ncbi:serine/threonine protein kinase [Pseudomonas putida]|uniref:serine/threonine-protein kinase n=1 Tax=Pseudomonas putida TaxID=303 RepID=UPI0023637E81|nr:serine/threonine-protein kinase [Pseudomonas putida]MDD1963751.1 serine/threonine protein kinase [Pseudomonas putida]
MIAVLPGLVIGNKLGNGHFGEVFQAQDDVHGQVAVKILSRQPHHTDAQWLKHKDGFLSEAQYLSRAKHRNVVEVYHFHEVGDSIRFAMAYCAGGSLQSAYESGPMSLPAVRKVATEVLMGLAALHARNMLHRDIKPGNILLDGDGVALLGDFGLVTDDLLLGYADQAGYLDHVAYEVWHGSGTSVKTDIWAMGMTLYRLLHGKAWYDEQIGQPKHIIKDGSFSDRLKWLAHVPKPWRKMIRKMLNDDSAARFQTSEEALDAVGRLPISPVWTVAEMTPGRVLWERTAEKRKVFVEWVRTSPRNHTWKAWSEPVGAGRNMTLGGSAGAVTAKQAITGLEAFFLG